MAFVRDKTGPLHERWTYDADDLDGGTNHLIQSQILCSAANLEDVWIEWKLKDDDPYTELPAFVIDPPALGPPVLGIESYVQVTVRNNSGAGVKWGGEIWITRQHPIEE